MKRSFFKKFIVATLALLVAVAAVGCGTEITYYYSVSDYDYYTACELYFIRSEVAAIEATATGEGLGMGEKWTVERYIDKLAKSFGWAVEKNASSDAVSYTLARSVERKDDDASGDDDSPAPTLKRGFLFNKYTYETDSPFSGIYSDLSGETAPAPSSIADVLKNGITDDNAQKVLPALGEAFTGISYADFADVKTSFVWNNSRITPVNGKNGYVGRSRVAVWESTLGDSPKLVYEVSSPNTVGWYILIAAVGCITVTIIMLATRGSRAKPKMVKMQSGRRVYPRIGGYYGDNHRTGKTDNIRVIDPFDDEPIGRRETPEDARKDLDDIFFGDDE